MSLPATAQKYVDDVAALREQFYPTADGAGASPGTANDGDGGAPTTVAQPPAPPAAPGGDVGAGGGSAAGSGVDGTAAAAAAGGGTGEGAAPPTDYEQKYKSLQDIFDGTRSDLDASRRALEELKRQNAVLQTQVAQFAQPVQRQGDPGAHQRQPEPAPTPLVTDADREEYGAEMLDLVRRVFREEQRSVDERMGARIQALEYAVGQLQGVAPKVANVERAQAMTAEQLFWAELKKQVPNWETIDRDESFLRWVLEPDRLSGQPRQSFLEAARRALDVRGVANVFRSWLEETGQTSGGAPDATATAQPPTANTGAGAGVAARSELDAQIAPGTSRAVPQPQQQQAAEPVSRAAILKFGDDVRRGLYAGKDTERQTEWNRLVAAANSGNVID